MASSTEPKPTATDTASADQQSVRVVKASFNLPERELDALREVARRRAITVTQALRQAIALFVWLANQSENSKFLVESPDGTRREVVFHNEYA